MNIYLPAINAVDGYPSLPDRQAQVRDFHVFCGFSLIAVVTKDNALLWTDSRYFLQAGKQLPSFWTLMKAGTPDCPKMHVLYS